VIASYLQQLAMESNGNDEHDAKSAEQSTL